MNDLLTYRLYRPKLSLSLHVQRQWGTVGIMFVRDDEEGRLHLSLPFLKGHLSVDAWAWTHVKGDYDDRQWGLEFHNGKGWAYWGRVPFARGRKDVPWVIRFPWFHVTRTSGKRECVGAGLPYTYQWKYQPDVIQRAFGTVYLEESSEQRYFGRWAIGTPRPVRSLWVDFSEEMGDERGGWKGGTTGAGFLMKPRQTWEQAYRQMQKERTFCRGK